ncbi:hypothetical protein ACEN2J_03405 [Pseudorhodobacter sp. W20_MBD10_FR17]|uniref:hypothetical protein n=1 Tax=Pseudorhodobacter sp. W20_MBD10_FR17 TaxID=3240266 RepID=UPI003F9445C1
MFCASYHLAAQTSITASRWAQAITAGIGSGFADCLALQPQNAALPAETGMPRATDSRHPMRPAQSRLPILALLHHAATRHMQSTGGEHRSTL